MKDRERILTHICQTLIIHKDQINQPYFLKKKTEFAIGNILIARTNLTPSEFSVGYYNGYDKEKGCVLIKDLISDKICEWYNEIFIEIPIEFFSKYELLCGKKYKILSTIIKSIKSWYYKFNELTFDDENETFTFSIRKPFTKDLVDSITLSQKLSLDKIKQSLEEWVIEG